MANCPRISRTAPDLITKIMEFVQLHVGRLALLANYMYMYVHVHVHVHHVSKHV